jgi:hypothetical protein
VWPPTRGSRSKASTSQQLLTLLDELLPENPWRVQMARGSGGRARSASSGKFISKAAAARHPRTSVVESGANHGKGTHHRSAITGHFVTEATAKRHPSTTVTEKG